MCYGTFLFLWRKVHSFSLLTRQEFDKFYRNCNKSGNILEKVKLFHNLIVSKLYT